MAKLMAIEIRNLYCDESGTNGKPYFLIGGLECTPRRAEIISNKIAILREQSGFYTEFKWTNIGNNSKYINLYKSLVDIFLSERFTKVYVIKFNKNENWKQWASTEEDRFFRCYYYFLRKNMNPYKRYNIYPDEKGLQKKYSWASLYWSLFNSFKSEEPKYKYGNNKNINILKPENSRLKDMIQLTDVLTNALFNESNNIGKQEVSNHLKHGNLNNKCAFTE